MRETNTVSVKTPPLARSDDEATLDPNLVKLVSWGIR
jgi:hypothetical protein